MDTIDTLDFAELEYDVGGAGAIEASDSRTRQAALVLATARGEDE